MLSTSQQIPAFLQHVCNPTPLGAESRLKRQVFPAEMKQYSRKSHQISRILLDQQVFFISIGAVCWKQGRSRRSIRPIQSAIRSLFRHSFPACRIIATQPPVVQYLRHAHSVTRSHTEIFACSILSSINLPQRLSCTPVCNCPPLGSGSEHAFSRNSTGLQFVQPCRSVTFAKQLATPRLSLDESWVTSVSEDVHTKVEWKPQGRCPCHNAQRNPRPLPCRSG